MFLFIIFSNIFVNCAMEKLLIFPNTSKIPKCQTPGGIEGVCTLLSQCQLSHFLLEIGQLSHCRFEGRNPVVCCPKNVGQIRTGPGSEFAKIVLPPPQVNFNCGERSFLNIFKQTSFADSRDRETLAQLSHSSLSPNHSRPPFPPFSALNSPSSSSFNSSPSSSPFPFPPAREDNGIHEVAGGEIASQNSWPWMALLGHILNGGDIEFFCSAVLINNLFAISAAHCVFTEELTFIRLGEHNYKPEDGSVLGEPFEDIPVESSFIHPRFNEMEGYNDIALIKFTRKVEFRDEVKPICLPWGRAMFRNLMGELVTVAGWGKEFFGGYSSSVLREVNVTIFDPQVCERSYATLRDYNEKFPRGMTTENILCAGDINGEKDACEGDSGGPLMNQIENEGKRYFMAGVISKGFGCGLKEFPGLYSPLGNQFTLQWIKDIAF